MTTSSALPPSGPVDDVAVRPEADAPEPVDPEPGDPEPNGDGPAGPIAADDPDRFINRELSWLDFNERVLELAADPATPLLERAKFLAIFSQNLDEFFQVRVAGLLDQVAAGVRVRTFDGRSPTEQVREVSARVRQLVERQEKLFLDEIVPALAANGIVLSSWDELDDDDRAYLVGEFERRIFPVLTPLAVDPGHPFPYISDLSLNLAVTVRDPVSGDLVVHSIARDVTERMRVEQELRASERNYREIFNSTRDAIVIHDAKTGSILDINDAAERMYGIARNDIQRLTIEDLSVVDEGYTLKAASARIAEAKKKGSVTFEWHARDRDGRTFWVEVTQPLTITSLNGPAVTSLKAACAAFNPTQRRVMRVNHAGALISGLGMVSAYTHDSAYAQPDAVNACALRIDAGTVTNCWILGSKGLDNSGGVDMRGGLLTHCVVANNTAHRTSNNPSEGKAGGIRLQAGTVQSCVITNNSACDLGAGLRITGGIVRDSLIAANRFRDNTSGYMQGAGVYMSGGTLERCTVVSNHWAKNGGGLYLAGSSATVRNCQFAGNRSFYDGAGVYLSSGNLRNVTVTGNRVVYEGANGLYQSGGAVSGAIVYGNGERVYQIEARNIVKTDGTFDYSCTWPAVEGTGNVAADPLFADAAAGDYRLRAGHPLNTNGVETAETPQVRHDFHGLLRFPEAGRSAGACRGEVEDGPDRRTVIEVEYQDGAMRRL